MKPISILAIALTAVLVISNAGSASAVQGSKGKQAKQPLISSVLLSPLASTLNNPIAVDYQETSDSVIASLNYVNGLPYNFVRVSRTGVVTQFSNASGFPEEVYIAVAPSQNCNGTGLSLGGFAVGDLFAGSGTGTVARISADGATVQNSFATLPGETGQEWGGLYFDRTGNFGGDLMVATTSGGIYRVKSTGGAATLVARLQGNRAVEGIITLPNDSRFGPLSGKILVGGTDIGIPSSGKTNILAVDPIDATHPMGTFTTYDLGPGVVEPEGFRIVPANGDFFGVDFGGSPSAPKILFTAPASGFSSIVGDLVIASEGDIDPTSKTSKLFDVVWDSVANKPKVTEIPGGSVYQYEGITFSCAAAPCVPSTLSCPPSTCINATAPSVVTFPTPVTTGGTNPGSSAVCTPPSGSVFALGTTTVNCTAPNGCLTGTASCSFSVTLGSPNLTLTDFTGNGSTVTLNTVTGAYTFICGNGASMSGTGTVVIRGGIITLNDVCVVVTIDCASGRAWATLKMPMATLQCSITARGVVCPACIR
jgi:hypothetical protein